MREEQVTVDGTSYALPRPFFVIATQNPVEHSGTCLTDVGRGFHTVVGTAFDMPMIDTTCTFCGQCLAVCPTGALAEVDNTSKVWDALVSGKTVVVQTAPAVRVALGEMFGMEPGEVVTGKMVGALRMLGFDYVYDTNFAADVTIMEEAAELVHRLKHGGVLPILTSCCPSWIKFIEHNFRRHAGNSVELQVAARDVRGVGEDI